MCGVTCSAFWRGFADGMLGPKLILGGSQRSVEKQKETVKALLQICMLVGVTGLPHRKGDPSQEGREIKQQEDS
jgi:hypothetical protein